MDGADDLAAVDALQVDAGDAEVGVPELALDHDERHTFVRHLDRVGVSELVRREAPSDAGSDGDSVHVCLCGGARPRPTAGWPADDAEQRPDG